MSKVRRSNPKEYNAEGFLVYTSKSGVLSNAIKKSLDQESFKLGISPQYSKTNGRKIKNSVEPFYDWSIFEFTEQKTHTVLGVPVYNATASNIITGLAYSNPLVMPKLKPGYIPQIEDYPLFIDFANALAEYSSPPYDYFNFYSNFFRNNNNIKRFLKDHTIFDTPNSWSWGTGYESPDGSSAFWKDRVVTRQSVDNVIKKTDPDYSFEPYSEENTFLNLKSNVWSNNELKELKDKVQIRLNLDFSSGSNAILSDTANVKSATDYLSLDMDVVSSKASQPTAYYNFIDNRWEYLKYYMPDHAGYTAESNYEKILPFDTSTDQITASRWTEEIKENISAILHDKRIMTSPSFRISENKTSYMKITNSCGFPNGRGWDPKEGHLLKMSDYIDSDFLLEKIIIKTKVKTHLSTDYNFSKTNTSNSSANYGLSFFLMRNIPEEKIKSTDKLDFVNFYVDADPSQFDPGGLYSQKTTELFKDENITSFIDSVNNDIFEFKSSSSKTDLLGYNPSNAWVSDNDILLGWDQILNGDIVSNNKFYYLSSGSYDSNLTQIKIADSIESYTALNYQNVYTVNETIETNSIPTFRDILTVNNVMFVGADIGETKSLEILNDSNIDLVVTRENNFQDIEIHSGLKSTFSSRYSDESIYLDPASDDNIFILEGKNKEYNSPRIFNKSYLKEREQNSYINDINYTLVDSDQEDKVFEYNYLIKPTDELIFGVSSYGNGNIISTLTEIADSIEIVLIGRPLQELKGFDSGMSTRKTIDAVGNHKNNIKSIPVIQKNNSFIKSKKNLVRKGSDHKRKIFKNKIKDSVLPNVVEYFELLDKTPMIYEASNFYEENYSLVNHIRSSQVDNTTKQKILFYDEVYENYLFELFKESVSFKNYITLDKTIKSSLEARINYDNFNYVSSHLGYANGGIYYKKFNKIKARNLNPLYDREYSLLLKSSLQNYTLPEFSNNNSALSIKNNTEFNFLHSNQNFGIELENNKTFQANITIQKFKKDYYLVLSGLEIPNFLPEFIRNLKSIDGFETEMFESDLFFKGSESSTRTFPITIRTLTVDGNIVSNLEDTSGFTKEFIYIRSENSNNQNDTGGEFLVAKLQSWELGDLVVNYEVSSPPSSRSEANEFSFTNGIYGRNNSGRCLIKTITGEFREFSAGYDVSNGFDYIDVISDDDFVNTNSSILRGGSSDLGLFIHSANNTFTCRFHHTVYKQKRASGSLTGQGNIYRYSNIIGDFNYNQIVNNSYYLYMDDNILQTDFVLKNKLYNNAGNLISKIPDVINNEVIYYTDIYYAPSTATSIDDIENTDYSIIFKYLDFEYNDIDFPQIFIYEVVSKSNESLDFLPDTNINESWSTIDLPQSGFIRVYEPRILDQYKKGLVKKDLVPYFEINLSDFSSTRRSEISAAELNTAVSGSLGRAVVTNNQVLMDGSGYDNLNRSLEYSYASWGSNEKKDQDINNTIYTYGQTYKFPTSNKKGYVYGVYSAASESPDAYFSSTRYGHASDHIKYTQNYVTISSIIGKRVVDYTVVKTFYNSYFEVVDNSSLQQTFNNSYYSESNYPFIENKDNDLSQINTNNPLFDENFVY